MGPLCGHGRLSSRRLVERRSRSYQRAPRLCFGPLDPLFPGLIRGGRCGAVSCSPVPGQPFAATILVGVVAIAAVAFGEEAAYRGYPIKNLAEGVAKARWGMGIAVVIPAVFFGLAHATNENATWLSTFNIVIFGLLFGTGYVLTGELALPIGLHFAWDFVQGFVFGVVANGKEYGSVLVLADDSSATLWTGRPYGAEGGLMGTAAFIAGFLATFAWARSQHRAALLVTRQYPDS